MTDQAERLRQLYQNRDTSTCPPLKANSARFIAVASGKGGVGKTNFVVNASLILSQWGLRVMIVDADMGMANVDIMLDINPRATLWHVIRGEKEIDEVVVDGPGNLKIVPGGSGFFELANLDASRRHALLKGFSSLKSDFIFIDCAAGISRNVLGFVGAVEEMIIVATPEPTSITDAYGMIKVAAERGLKPRTFLVVNRANSYQDGDDVFQRMSLACKRFLGIKLHYLGSIGDDALVTRAVQRCAPFVLSDPDSHVSSDLRRVVERLLGDPQKAQTNSGSSLANFFLRFFRL